MLCDRSTETNGLQNGCSKKSYIEINCDELFDLIEGMQSRRLEEQRAPMPIARESFSQNGSRSHKDKNSRDGYSESNRNTSTNNEPNSLQEINENILEHSEQMPLGVNICLNDEFFDLLIKCQSSRLEDQRTSLPSSLFTLPKPSENSNRVNSTNMSLHSNDVQDEISIDQELSSIHEAEDFYIFLMSIQSATRIEDQRTTFPIVKNYTNISSNEK